jgi:hypothetical protein
MEVVWWIANRAAWLMVVWRIEGCHAMADSMLPCYGRFPDASVPWQIPGQQELIADSSRHAYGRFAM